MELKRMFFGYGYVRLKKKRLATTYHEENVNDLFMTMSR